ncbi:hypothetical protein FOZ61_000420 [Perkinsus olseni]|uniref:Uncharacterized protein n=1 Tax=Perkinsus olseni TaxID=32597 RepID=A0A7J6KT98_PEROL|nr:hypothetical protein FOZ61_000420 [Perkinsus olseni]
MKRAPLSAGASSRIGFMTAMGKATEELKHWPLRMYVKDCPEGETVAVTWCEHFDCWLIHAGRASVLLKKEEDDDAIDNTANGCGEARMAAAAWSRLLLRRDNSLARSRSEATFIGESVGVDPKTTASVLRAWSALVEASDDEGNGLRMKVVNDKEELTEALREAYFAGIPDSPGSGNLGQCQNARTAIYLCTGEEEHSRVLLADFSKTAKFQLLSAMRHDLSALAGRGLKAQAGVKCFRRQCERILDDKVGSSYAFEAYVALFKNIGKVATAAGQWNCRAVHGKFLQFAEKAAESPRQAPKNSSVVLIHAPPGIVPADMLTFSIEVDFTGTLSDMVRRGGMHVARTRDISFMKHRPEEEEIKVISVGWDGSVDDVMMRSFETAGRMNLCNADVEFFEMDAEDQVEEITRCYHIAARENGRERDWVRMASSVEELPEIIEQFEAEQQQQQQQCRNETLGSECRIVLVDAPPGYVPHELITDDVVANVETIESLRRGGGKHGERRFASAKLGEQSGLIGAWFAQQEKEIPDASSLETVSDKARLKTAIARLLRNGAPVRGKPMAAAEESLPEDVAAEQEFEEREEDEDSLSSGLSATTNPVDHIAAFKSVDETPVIEAEVVVDESPPDTIMTVADEATAVEVDDSAAVDGSASSSPASPPEKSPSSVVEAKVIAPTDVPVGDQEAVIAIDPVAAAERSHEQVTAPSRESAGALTEGVTSRVEETQSRRGMVVIIHAPPGVVPRDLLTEDGVPGERQIQKLLDDGGDHIVHACTLGFLFRFKFPHERVAVIKYGWEGAIQDVITRTLAHAGDDDKSTQDERFFASDMSEQGGLFARWYKQASKNPPRGVKTASPASEKLLRDAVHRMLGDTPRASRTVLLVLPLGLPGSGASQLLRTMFDKLKVNRAKLLQGKSRAEDDGCSDAVVSNAALINARDFAKRGAMDSTALGAALRRASGDFVERNVKRSKQGSTHVIFLDLNHTNTHSVKTSAKNFMINGVDVKVLALLMAEVPGTTELASWQYPWSPQGILSCLKREIDSHGDSEGFDSRMTEHFFELCKQFEKGTFSEEDLPLANDLAGMIEPPADSERSNLDSISDEILSRITAIASES